MQEQARKGQKKQRQEKIGKEQKRQEQDHKILKKTIQIE